MVHENCGVVGIFSVAGHNVVPFAIDMLRALQHRGQEAWGIAVPKKPPFKRLGLVSASAMCASAASSSIALSTTKALIE